jgi:hypothetical protein
MFIVRHFRPHQTFGQSCSAVELRPVKLSSRQAFDVVQIGIRQIGAIQLGKTQIRTAQIGTA